ncbi:MAG TPA: bifunctional glutamate N-acetyltransferase/amino-acid acetyltransferase ArgJ [Solirubrobacteraceae bacterium]|nr:bifunctional glutamate N-acetyltransferase/amino-acid acetyltransferase ArgJ [Solirubrobacteraceae bacterium]
MSGEGFFNSRWVERPVHVTEDEHLPEGFRLGGAACGVMAKGSQELDLGIVVCDSEAAVSAARFCDSGVLAAPVVVTRERCDLGAIRAVVANSGNANAATGEAGIAEAVRVQQAAADALGISAREVAVASTGVIGVALPGQRIASAIPALAARLDGEGAGDFAQAIRTTDAIDKHVALRVALPSGTVRLAAQAKGAGMISPHFATMLCFIETDAVLTQPLADALLGTAVARSFDRISVDGQLSTNDTAILLASGASAIHVEAGSEDEKRFARALEALLRQLALRMVADGEGARRIARVTVRGAGEETVERVGRSVANSPLVKAALFGGDPNWGRIAQAIGAALPGTAPLSFEIAIEGIAVARDGEAIGFERAALEEAVARNEVEYDVALPGEGAEAELFFSDLSYDYVKINAEYTT